MIQAPHPLPGLETIGCIVRAPAFSKFAAVLYIETQQSTRIDRYSIPLYTMGCFVTHPQMRNGWGQGVDARDMTRARQLIWEHPLE